MSRIAAKLATKLTNATLRYNKYGRPIRKQSGPGCLLLILFSFLMLMSGFNSSVFASCEEDCKVPKSYETYLEARTAYMNCLTACKQKEAAEMSVQASEKIIKAAENMAVVFEKTIVVLEKVVVLLEKTIAKLYEKEVREGTDATTPPSK